jgi:hypothetical protein
MIVFDSDDFGCNHEISDMCQSHDCRDILEELHKINPAFKATLFAIPGEMTTELINWAVFNSHWIELAVHGFYHSSNYECEKINYDEFDELMNSMPFIQDFFVKGFKAWQISDDALRWLKDHGWWVADQPYNNDRRPKDLPSYCIMGNEGKVLHNDRESSTVFASHHHTWNCMGNGVYEQFDYIVDLIKDKPDFKFVSELIYENTTNQEQAQDSRG